MYALNHTRWQEVLHNLRATGGKNWKLFRKSKTGLVGLFVILAFLVMASAAPLLTPFTPGYLAPSLDILQTDRSEVALDPGRGWGGPVGVLSQGGLSQVLVYTAAGRGMVVDVGSAAKGSVVGLVVTGTANLTLPGGIRSLEFQPYDNTTYLVVAGDRVLQVNSQFNVVYSSPLGLVPAHQSNVWNSEQIGTRGYLLRAYANGSFVNLYAVAPRTVAFNPTAPRIFVHAPVALPEAVVGDPVIIFLPQDNFTAVILPVADGLLAYAINLTKVTTALGDDVQDIALGPALWRSADKVPGVTIAPLPGPSVTLPATDPLVDTGKDRVLVATTGGEVLALYASNGTLAWRTPAPVALAHITGIHSAGAREDVVLTGTQGPLGFLASVDPDAGTVGAEVATLSAPIDNVPTWIQGGLRWFLTTRTGDFFVLDQDLKLNATYRTGGTSGTPGVYLGNIFQTGQTQTGNYYGTIQGDDRLVLLLLPGQNIAPLAPGRYASGNRYLLGTDEAGHDLWTWMVYGSQSELLLGITSALFAVGLGTLVGLVAGYKGGLVDTVLMRTVDTFLALPGLVLVLLLVVVLGPSIFNIILIVGLLSWAPISRVIRSVTLSLKSRAYVDAARVAGASSTRIVFRHIAPNVMPLTFLYMSITVSTAIILEALLSFLGFGDANHVTWGMSLQFLEISGHVLNAPWWLFPPGIAISLISLSFYLVGRAMDEIVNPKLRAR